MVSDAHNECEYATYVEREEGYVLIAVIDVVYDSRSCLARPVHGQQPVILGIGYAIRGAFLRVDQVGDLKVQG